ncbi:MULTISPECIES: carbonic anhydrase [unclassified Leifsonia]|uniref:carbonic anhydrase n=1 Tax=unclassified Leifsonia TaxID=2663824 RepID=UPI0008A739CF|nr:MULTISPECIES: carbonic anhydrase [unclassified Leifsonia]SEH91531.1 carbonic anhydrase [Leifsonia sp. CL154]SFL52279.1 carbonic anhydrase [Leifsonia sp. CL147]
MPTTRPGKIWTALLEGNARFIAGEPQHPHQDVTRRESVAGGQEPVVAIFGCSDSRLAAEIIFDLGLGDAFVIRNAGQVVSGSVLGSLEYAVAVLHIPLILVLGHDSCGAVASAIASQAADAEPLPPHIADLIAPIVPAVHRVTGPGAVDPRVVDASAVGREHLRDTVSELLARSEIIASAVAENTLGIVGANYRLAEGRAVPDVVVGLSD